MVATSKEIVAVHARMVGVTVVLAALACVPHHVEAQADALQASVLYRGPRLSGLRYEPPPTPGEGNASKARAGNSVKGGAIAGAIVGAVVGILFVAVNDDDTGTKVGVALGSVAVGAGAGALLGLLVSSVD